MKYRIDRAEIRNSIYTRLENVPHKFQIYLSLGLIGKYFRTFKNMDFCQPLSIFSKL